jgi:hypothetical protein
LASGASSRRPVGVGAGEGLLAGVAGVGEHGAQLRPDPGRCQLVPAPVEQRVQQGAVDRVLGQHRTDDDLLAGDHELAVVPGHIALLVAHHPHVRVGDVRPRLGVVAVRARRLVGRAVAAPFPGRRGRLPGLLLGPLRVAAGLVLGRQPVPRTGQPIPPLSPPGQRPRGRLVQLVAEPGVFGSAGVHHGSQQPAVCGTPEFLEPSRRTPRPGYRCGHGLRRNLGETHHAGVPPIIVDGKC